MLYAVGLAAYPGTFGLLQLDGRDRDSVTGSVALLTRDLSVRARHQHLHRLNMRDIPVSLIDPMERIDSSDQVRSFYDLSRVVTEGRFTQAPEVYTASLKFCQQDIFYV